ncbi:MAG: peptidylprolyl isomerase [Candidatus Marinimicrobia bacterium]|nr:peptidylprolyl isomerase [Candidatus Neomarinimicrobiota bacterium]
MSKNNALIFLTVFLSSCGNYPEPIDSPVIAATAFGDIRLDEFIDDYKTFLNFTGVEDNMMFRNGLLNSEIDRLFILNYAAESQFLENPLKNKSVENSIGQTLLNEFYEREIEEGFEVPDDLVREAFHRSKIELHARHLYAISIEEAQSLKNRLDQGETFEELAKEIFTSPQLAASGGDLGYFTFNDMDPSFEGVAYSLKDGEISNPVQTLMGFSIIQVLDRNYDPIITEYDYQMHKDDFLAIMKYRLLKTKVKKLTNEYASQYELNIKVDDMHTLFDHFSEIIISEDKVPSELTDIFLESGDIQWDAQEICSHIRETTENQQRQVQSTDDLFDMLTGLCVRDRLFRNIENTEWRNSENVLKKIRDAKEQRTIKLLMDDVYRKALALQDSVVQKEIYFTFITNLKKDAEIKIDHQLLKSFSL